MTIEISEETLVALKAIPELLPDRPHRSTIERWRLRGIRGVKLETIMIGGKRYTSTEAIQRFIERTTAAAAGQPAPSQTAAQRRKAIEQAERQLESEGL